MAAKPKPPRRGLRSRPLDDGAAILDAGDFPECRELVDRYVVRHRNYYRRRATRVRRFFRIGGVMVIVCSGALPIVAFVGGSGSRLLITILSVAVAGLTALRTFFQWDVQWRVLRQADWKLTYLLATWEARMRELSACQPAGDACAAITLTRKLIDDARTVIEEEAASFFRGLGWPNPDKKDDPPHKDETETAKATGGHDPARTVTIDPRPADSAPPGGPAA